jgi:hypothetical protein
MNMSAVKSKSLRILMIAAVIAVICFTLIANIIPVSASGIDSYTKLMLHMNGADEGTTFTDDSGNGHNGTAVGNANTEQATKYFGNASLELDGTGDYVTVADSDDWDLGSGNFTVDFWLNSSDANFYTSPFMRPSASGFASSSYGILINQGAANGYAAFWCGDYNLGAAMLVGTSSVMDGNWHHIAVVRNGNVWDLYVDGTSQANVTSSITIATSARTLYIGVDPEYAGRDLAGFIDEFRLSKGIARWTTNFAVPVAEYTTGDIRYWVGDTGDWSDATNHWATTSGGAPGAGNLPDATMATIFDTSSFTAGSKIVTVDVASVCASMTFTDATDAPDLKMTDTLTVGGNVTFLAGVTVSGASAIIITGTGNFDGAGITFPELQLNGSAHTISGANTFTTLTRTGTAADTTLTLAADQIVSGTLTLAGNSIHNRLTVQSSVHTTQRTLTAAVVTPTNVDFHDTIAAGASHPWDVSAITGGSVDLGNNTDITFSVDRYWVGASGAWSDAATHWAFSSGGVADAIFLPTATLDANFDANSGFVFGNKTISVDSSANYDPLIDVCNNLDFTGVTNTPTISFGYNQSPNIRVIGISGSLTLSTGMTITHASNHWIGPIGFRFLSGNTGNTITTNGVSLSIDLTFIGVNGTAEWTLQDTLTQIIDVQYTPNLTVTNGILITGNKTINIIGLTINGGTITAGSSSITCTSFTYTSGTFTAGTSTINDSGNFGGGGQTYSTVNLNGTASTITGSNTFTTLTFTGTATQTDSRTLTTGTTQTVTGTFTATGNSATNRLMVMSSAASTATINAAVTAITNTDFYYTTGAGAGDWDISAVAGESVNFGGCSGITFTYPYDATRNMYWYGGTGNYNSSSVIDINAYHWSNLSNGAGAKRLPNPTATNSVYFDANSFTVASKTVSLDTIAYCHDMNWTGALWSPVFQDSGTNRILYISGSLTLVASMTFNIGGSGNQLRFTSSTNETITTNGVILNLKYGAMNAIFFEGATGIWTLQDDAIFGGNVTLDYGTLDTNNKTVSFNDGIGNVMGFSSSNANTRTLTLGSSIINCASWTTTTTTNLIFTANTATINCSGNFSGGGLTAYSTVNITGASTISGNNTFTTLNITGATASITGNNTITTFTTPSGTTQTFTITAGTVQTITGTATLSGDSTHTHTFTSGNTWTISKASGTVVANYLSLSYSTASGGALFYAGSASTNGGNNTGWIWKTPPVASTSALITYTSTTATMIGTVNNVGGVNQYASIFVYFELADPTYWGVHSGDPDSTRYNPALRTPEQTITTNGTVSYLKTGLTNSTIYHYRITIRYDEGGDQFVYGNDMNFTTPNYPDVVTGSTVNPTSSSATIQGVLTYLGGYAPPLDVAFRWGPTAALGSVTPVQSIDVGNYSQLLGNVTGGVGTLIANQTYYYQAIVYFSGVPGYTVGAIEHFQAKAAIVIPVTTQPFSPEGGNGSSIDPGTIPNIVEPSTWWADGLSMNTLPFYEVFDDAATQMNPNNPTVPIGTTPVGHAHPTTLVLYLMAILATAMAAGYGVILFTGSSVLALGTMAVLFGIGASMTIVSGWMVFVLLLLGICIWYLAKFT